MLEDKEIGFILHKAAMLSKNSLTGKLNEFGITPGQFTVIKEISNHDKSDADIGLSPACIADKMQCDRPTVSGIIDRLEAQDWITRLQNPEDKRSCIIHATEKALESLQRLDEIYKENQNIILSGFSKEEADLFKTYLLRVINNFKGMEEL